MPLTVYDFRADQRNLVVTPQIRARFMRLDPGEVATAHSHDLGQEIFLVLAGRAEFTIAGETAQVGPGQLCVAFIDQLHSVRALGEEPMVMYLSVTPHIQPTHTFWDRGGRRRSHRFVRSSTYDYCTDSATPLGELLDRLQAATLSVGEAAAAAAAVQSSQSQALARDVESGRLDRADERRGKIWDALAAIQHRGAELTELWNDVAPRAGRT